MRRTFLILFLALAVSSTAFGRAKITIQNNDAAGVGFNDPTAATPVGGNNGTTLGEQRLNAFRYAASVWEQAIDSSVEIIIGASFAPLDCTANDGTLGSAGPANVAYDFPNAPLAGVWYPIALANKFAGEDLVPGKPDINARFNQNLGKPDCLPSTNGWYYGLDGNHGSSIDLVVVLLHEFAHGLGFTGVTDLQKGTLIQGKPSLFEHYTLDLSNGLHWDQMTDAQRVESTTRTGQLVWDGESGRSGAAQTLARVTTLTVTEPSALARNFDIGTAAFGADPSKSAVSGLIVAANDPADTAGSSTTDGCTLFTNAADVRGNIALVDRGSCNFTVKAANAQAAGAKALVIIDNKRDTCTPPGLGGTDDTVRIPVISVRADDGQAIRQAAGVRAMLRVDPSTFAGASTTGFVRLYAPCTVSTGSSVHHWDVTSVPNLLMEPSINEDLGHGVDITINQLMDIGWSRSPNPGPPTGRRTLKRGK